MADVFSGTSPLTQFDSVESAWRGVLSHLSRSGIRSGGVSDPNSVGSGFGSGPRETREALASGFTITNPRCRLVRSVARPIDLGFALANVIWTMLASDELAFIGAYNERAVSFSEDGSTLYGALGPRLLKALGGDQLEHAVSLLKRDPGTRRAVVQVYASGDLGAQTRDCPCLVSLQFLVRDGLLHCIGHMRSQSALMVLPYDLFLLTMLQEVVAVRLELPLGSYHHFCSSLHYYNDESALVGQVLSESPTGTPEMPIMSPEPASLWTTVASAELAVRTGTQNVSEAADRVEQVSGYWGTLLRVMWGAARSRQGNLVPDRDLVGVPPLYVPLILGRQP
jgi:thymidylate synthase